METSIFLINEFERALLMLDRSLAEQIVLRSVQPETPMEVAGNLITSTLRRIGDSWERGTVSLSQVYMSGLICEEIIDKILPPFSPDRTGQPCMAIGVFEDYHLLGKRIIFSTLRASGYELIDLGGGLKTSALVETVQQKGIEILLLSVLMLPSALRIKNLKQELAGTGVKIVVGGAPFRLDDQLWKEVGADACGKDSSEALRIVEQMTGRVK